jgi:uncharacterized LabA/DUF88 family protein
MYDPTLLKLQHALAISVDYIQLLKKWINNTKLQLKTVFKYTGRKNIHSGPGQNVKIYNYWLRENAQRIAVKNQFSCLQEPAVNMHFLVRMGETVKHNTQAFWDTNY